MYVQDKENTVGQFVINLKNNRTEYCGYVVYKPESEWGRSGSENASFCITLPGEDEVKSILFSHFEVHSMSISMYCVDTGL